MPLTEGGENLFHRAVHSLCVAIPAWVVWVRKSQLDMVLLAEGFEGARVKFPPHCPKELVLGPHKLLRTSLSSGKLLQLPCF